MKNLLGKFKRRLKELVIDGRIIMTWIIMKYNFKRLEVDEIYFLAQYYKIFSFVASINIPETHQ